jgi:hypothetical protein
MNAEIHVNKGFGDLLFGETIMNIVALVGEPTKKVAINDDPSFDTTLLEYHNHEFNLFFEIINAPVLTSIDIYNEEATLWAHKIFELSFKEIIALFKANGFVEYEEETHTWGEKRISFDDANTDLYFEKDVLTSITISHHINYNTEDFMFSVN